MTKQNLRDALFVWADNNAHRRVASSDLALTEAEPGTCASLL